MSGRRRTREIGLSRTRLSRRTRQSRSRCEVVSTTLDAAIKIHAAATQGAAGQFDLATRPPRLLRGITSGATRWTISTWSQAHLVFEWIEGQPLSAVLGDHRMSFGARSRVAAKTAAAVARMHQAGITHGDLKPRNVLITATDPTFIDPDAMRIHRFPAGLTKRARRDWQTLVSSLNETSVDPALIQKILVRAAPREADVGRSDLNRG